MFDGCLELCRTFIGVQPVSRGCSAAELSDFICEDVLPYQGWAANATLRDTIVRLLLSTPVTAFTLYTSPVPASGAASPPQSTRARKGSSAAVSPPPLKEGEAPPRIPVSFAQALAYLDAGSVDFSAAVGGVLQAPVPAAAPSPSSSSSARSPAEGLKAAAVASSAVQHALFFVPGRELRERALGFAIRSEGDEAGAQFLVEAALHGWDHLPKDAAFRARYKNYLLHGALKRLRKTHLVTLSYLYHPASHQVLYRHFPHFAQPLTEREKTEEPAWRPHGDTVAAPSDGGAGVGEAHPAAVVWSRQCRRLRPLDHYYARRRQQDASFPSVVFDLQLVRRLIVDSPERRLLLEDAMHAIFTTHRLPAVHWRDFNKSERMHLRRLLDCAGLRIVVAAIQLRGRLRRLRIVLPAEDLWRELAPATEHRPLDGGDGAGRALAGLTPEPEEEDGEEEADAESRSGGSSDLGSDEESESAAAQGEGEGEALPGSAGPRPTVVQRQADAATVLRIAPGQLVEVQAAHEAERRPLSITSVFPHVRLQLSVKISRNLASRFLDRYKRLRNTLETQYLPLHHSSSFTAVYAPHRPPLDALQVPPPPVTVKQEPMAASEGGGGGSAEQQQQGGSEAASAAAPPPNPLHFVDGDPRLPKGVTAYAVNVVVEALLQATPHHAVSLPRLGTLLDVRAISRRVLPLLRQLGLVYTTGVTRASRQRVGLVVLRTPTDAASGAGGLDEEAKRAVLEAEAAAALEASASNRADAHAGGAAPAARPPPLPSGRAMPSELVLTAVPAMAAALEHSTKAADLMRAHPMVTRLVNRVMAVRNGYARSLTQRVSRLHLELWAQHCEAAARDASVDVGAAVRVCDMFDRMHLSSYCIVVGLPQADLADIVSGTGPQQVCWSTPLKALPPSLYGWCLQQGMQALCVGLAELQDRQLLRGGDNFQQLLSVEMQGEVHYALRPAVTVDGYTHTFATRPVCAAASLYACMRYWLPTWNAMQRTQRDDEAALVSAEPNPSVAQVVALSRVLRRDTGAVAAQVYQNCGVPRGLRRSRGLREMQSGEGASAAAAAAASGMLRQRIRPSRRHQRRRRDDGDDDGGREEQEPEGEEERGLKAAPTRTAATALTRRSYAPPPRSVARTEINGATVAAAFENAFHHFSPLRRVEELVRLMLRGRTAHLTQHSLFSVPPLLPPLLLLLRYGSAAAQESGAVSSPGNACRTEFNTSHAGQGGAAYNRMLSPAILHMGELGEALRVLSDSRARHQTHPHRHARPGTAAASFPPAAASTATAAAAAAGVLPQLAVSFSAVDPLRADVESVFAPRAALPVAPQELAETVAAAAAASPPLAPPAQSTTSVLDTEGGSAQMQQEADARLVAILEVLSEILRMTLLSDQAHWRPSVVRGLLAALGAEVLVTRARLLLQRMPAFRRTRRHNFRVPLLSLVQCPYVLPPSALRGAPRPCANLSVLHALAAEMDAVGAALSGGPERHGMRGTARPLEALLHAAAAGDGGGDAFSPAACVAVPLRLVQQPTLEVARLSMAPAMVREVLTKLPLPQLSWPASALRCEHVCRPPEERDRGAAPPSSSSAGAAADAVGETPPQHRRRRRRAQPRTAARSSVRSDESDADSEDGRAARRAEAEATQQLYPARSVRNHGDPPYLQALPMDGPPTAAELEAVERCRQLLAAGDCAAVCGDAADSPFHITYPSIFHHVDGSFHWYMWHMVVHTVYRYLLRVPGVAHADLEARLMASGLLSARAVRAVLRFLLDRQLVRCVEEEMADDLCVRGGGLLGAGPRVHGPFHRSTNGADVGGGDGGAGLRSLERCMYTAVAPLEAVQFSISAAAW